MVYINDTSGTVTIPKHIYSESSGYTLLLKSNMANDIVLVENGSDISTNPLYYKLALSDIILNVGEYTYILMDAETDDILEEGLLTYGNYKREVIVNNTTRDKIQYNG